eukprot:GHVS01105227.1.p1 GENE.GHVS01105227.1~~GHVS01105227.1.p1  ORF type:complete len:168 (-),score=34.83 GHVS01105227.1:196-699(-)
MTKFCRKVKSNVQRRLDKTDITKLTKKNQNKKNKTYNLCISREQSHDIDYTLGESSFLAEAVKCPTDIDQREWITTIVYQLVQQCRLVYSFLSTNSQNIRQLIAECLGKLNDEQIFPQQQQQQPRQQNQQQRKQQQRKPQQQQQQHQHFATTRRQFAVVIRQIRWHI